MVAELELQVQAHREVLEVTDSVAEAAVVAEEAVVAEASHRMHNAGRPSLHATCSRRHS